MNKTIYGNSLSILDLIIIGLLAYISIFGQLSFLTIKLFGAVVTSYRVFTPLILIYFVLKRLLPINKNPNNYSKNGIFNKYYVLLICVFVVLLLYGGVLWGISPYVDSRMGILELFNITWGVFSILTIYEISLIEGGLDVFFRALRVLLVCYLLFGFFEITTGLHSYLSRYSNTDFISSINREGATIRMATGYFTNENDYSMLFGLFSPLFYPRRKWDKKDNILGISVLCLIVIMISINDAWICLVSVFLGLMFYLSLSKIKLKTWINTIVSFTLTHYVGSYFFMKIVNFLNIERETLLSKDVLNNAGQQENGIMIDKKNFGKSLANQIAALENQKGSMYMRLLTYTTSIKQTFVKTFGLGFGPGSFNNFIESECNSDLLSNPHSFWIEILTQYGIINLFLFTFLLLKIFGRLIKLFLNNGKEIIAIVLTMDFIYAFISFASSSFLGFHYIWVPIGISLALTKND